MDSSQTFSQAAPAWLRDKELVISERTIHDYNQYIRALNKFFANIPLKEIHIGHLREYQRERRNPSKEGARRAGAHRINMEIGCLGQVLQEAGLWAPIEKSYKRLKVSSDGSGQALSPEDEAKLFFVAKTRKRWLVAFCCGLITANTTLTEKTLKNLRLNDINLSRRTINAVKGVKNKYREREIDLNEAAFYAVNILYQRCVELHERYNVPIDPHKHVLLPHRAHLKGQIPNFEKPMYGIRKAWVNLREAAGFPKLRYYDLRHTAITKLLEDPNISEATVIDIAGHVNHKMLKRYSHIRKEKRQAAVKSIDTFYLMETFFKKAKAGGGHNEGS